MIGLKNKYKRPKLIQSKLDIYQEIIWFSGALKTLPCKNIFRQHQQ